MLRPDGAGNLGGVSDHVPDAVANAHHLDEAERGDWNVTANNSVALLRAEAGRNPYDVSADSGLTLIACGAEPGTSSVNNLRLLATWSAIQPGAEVALGTTLRDRAAVTAVGPPDMNTKGAQTWRSAPLAQEA